MPATARADRPATVWSLWRAVFEVSLPRRTNDFNELDELTIN